MERIDRHNDHVAGNDFNADAILVDKLKRFRDDFACRQQRWKDA